MGQGACLGGIHAQSRARVARGEDHISIDPPNLYPEFLDELRFQWPIRKEDGLFLLLFEV